MAVKKSLKWAILAYASEPDKSYNYFGDYVEYKGKRYFVSLAEERVEFVGNIENDDKLNEEKVEKVETPNPEDCSEECEVCTAHDSCLVFSEDRMED